MPKHLCKEKQLKIFKLDSLVICRLPLIGWLLGVRRNLSPDGVSIFQCINDTLLLGANNIEEAVVLKWLHIVLRLGRDLKLILRRAPSTHLVKPTKKVPFLNPCSTATKGNI